MTATEELRRMLDKRGVEWMDDSYAQLWCTVWYGQDGKQWRMTENRSGMLTELKAWHVTPEQAIVATLGVGTCHVKAAKKIGDLFGFSLSCGHSMVNPFNDHPDYCPWCGRRVVEEDA